MNRNPAEKIRSLSAAVEWRESLRKSGRKLVITNGCFDILHRGHAEYLYESRALGDALLILINSDRAVQELKGPTRPIIPEEHRAYMIGALESVDAVVVFDLQRCDKELRALSPDIYVKGGDYTLDKLDASERAALLESGAEIVFKPFIGLTAQQFSQVAMIAQGDFQKLLLTESKDRQKIFTTLFSTENFSKFTELLRKKEGEARAEKESLSASILMTQGQIELPEMGEDFSREEWEKVSDSPYEREKILETLDRAVKLDQAFEQELLKKIAANDDLRAGLSAAVQSGEELIGRLDRLEKAEQELVLQKLRASEIENTEKRLELAETNSAIQGCAAAGFISARSAADSAVSSRPQTVGDQRTA